MARQCVWHPGTGILNGFLCMDLWEHFDECHVLTEKVSQMCDGQRHFEKVMYSYVVSTLPADGLEFEKVMYSYVVSTLPADGLEFEKVMYSYVVSTLPADGLELGMTKSGPHIDVRQVLQKFRMHGRSCSLSFFHQDIEAR